MQTQFIIDSNGKKRGVLLSIKEYEKMIDELEELEDIKLYDRVKARREPRISIEEYLGKRKKRKYA